MRRRAVRGAVLALLSLLALSAPAIAVPSKPAVVRCCANLQWHLREALSSGPADITFNYGTGARGDRPLFGDWDGDGDKTAGVLRPNRTFLLRNSNTSGVADLTVTYGTAGDLPVVGDWDGDGSDTVGMVRPRDDGRLQWLLRNSNTPGAAQISVTYGRFGPDFPIVGDWNGDGTDTVGVVRATSGGRLQWLLSNSFAGGAADVTVVYGLAASDLAVTGDWNDDNVDTVGVVRGARWLLRNSNTGGGAQLEFVYGTGGANEAPLVWR
jgi:hypothetical protein